MKKKGVIICVVLLIFLSGCSLSENVQTFEDSATQKFEEMKQDLSNKFRTYVEKKVNSKVDNAVKDIESSMDPKLREIRNNMQNIKEAVLVYYKINKKMPALQRIEALFPVSFKQMDIQYRISNDSQRAFITYIGKDYSKDKVGEIVVEPNN